jgi:hypothetical protein
MPFCKDCLELGSDPTLLSPDFSRTLKASFSDCEAAAAEGCQFCLLIKQSYEEPGKEYLRNNIAPDQPLKVYRGPNHNLSELAVDVPCPTLCETWNFDIYISNG